MLYAPVSQQCGWGVELSRIPNERPTGYSEAVFSALSAGFFLVLVGTIFVITPNLFAKIIDFFQSFTIVRVPNTPVHLPAPAFPRTHTIVYSAGAQFSLVWGMFQIVVLVIRFVARSPLSKKAETAGNLVFWLGTNILVRTFLTELTTRTTWFAFWTTILMLVGVSLIVRAIILAFRT